MELNVNKLEALFLKVEADLDYASCQLEAQLTAASTQKTGVPFNPMKMLQSVQNLKKEYEALLKEADELREAQQKIGRKTRGELSETCKKLQELQVRAGVQLPREFGLGD